MMPQTTRQDAEQHMQPGSLDRSQLNTTPGIGRGRARGGASMNADALRIQENPPSGVVHNGQALLSDMSTLSRGGPRGRSRGGPRGGSRGGGSGGYQDTSQPLTEHHDDDPGIYRYENKRTLSISCWNVNGWTLNNSILRSSIIVNKNSDIVCICETHLRDHDVINMTGYAWYGHNRHSRNVRAWRGSGGIGIFVKDEITQIFTVTIIDNTFDGILGIALTHKWSGVRLAVCVCYLPPSTSIWGRNADAFFSHLELSCLTAILTCRI